MSPRTSWPRIWTRRSSSTRARSSRSSTRTSSASPGGEPYGALIGDYEFTNHPEDIELLSQMSNVAAAAFCPFISAAAPKLFGFDRLDASCPSRATWRRSSTRSNTPSGAVFRDTEDSRVRHAGHAARPGAPARTARPPSRSRNSSFEEGPIDAKGNASRCRTTDYSWMNAAYVLGTKLTDAFAKYGWCTAIRGAEGGGKVEGLPAPHLHQRRRRPRPEVPDRDRHHRPPRGRAQQARLPAALPLQEHRLRRVLRRPDRAEAQEVRPAGGDGQRGHLGPAAVHHGHVAVRPLPQGDGPRQDRLVHGGRRLRGLAQSLDQATTSTPRPGADEAKAKFPLREAKVQVKEIPGKPGSYNAVVHLRPWLQMEELTASLRMVARIPQKA